MKEIVVIELFAGIGGFVKGLIDAGFKIKEHYFSEIDKHAIANYKYNFPNAKYIGSVTDISGRDFTGIDIITFGSPCQDFSIAGKGEGMGGQRSVLILEAIRLVTELRPPVFIWENVKGAFSSNAGADFWAILQAFANIGGYRLEWQLLNTKWFLPQNRERIYLVGHLAERSKPGVFPISEDNCWVDEGAIETRSVRTLTAGGNSGGLHSSMTLIQSFGRNEKQKLNVKENPDHANCLTSRMHKDFKENMISSFNRDSKGKVTKRSERSICNTITSATGMGGSTDVFVNNIRRLTEIECERLQGFPDNWTEYGNYDGIVKKIPKTQRYKMLGNAVTVRVVEEIAKRIELL